MAAFIGPLIAFLALLGAFIAWLLTRTAKYVQSKITEVQSITNERILRLTEELHNQGKVLEQQQKQIFDTATAVARIEGQFLARKESS